MRRVAALTQDRPDYRWLGALRTNVKKPLQPAVKPLKFQDAPSLPTVVTSSQNGTSST
jgi:hypothetical protein